MLKRNTKVNIPKVNEEHKAAEEISAIPRISDDEESVRRKNDDEHRAAKEEPAIPRIGNEDETGNLRVDEEPVRLRKNPSIRELTKSPSGWETNSEFGKHTCEK